jgi:hypothetical protein
MMKVNGLRRNLKAFISLLFVTRRKHVLICICSDYRNNKTSMYHKMSSLKGMDELLWGKKFEDVHD